MLNFLESDINAETEAKQRKLSNIEITKEDIQNPDEYVTYIPDTPNSEDIQALNLVQPPNYSQKHTKLPYES